MKRILTIILLAVKLNAQQPRAITGYHWIDGKPGAFVRDYYINDSTGEVEGAVFPADSGLWEGTYRKWSRQYDTESHAKNAVEAEAANESTMEAH